MGWSIEFNAELGKSVLRPIYTLTNVQIGIDHPLGSTFELSSAYDPINLPSFEPALAPEGCRVSYGSVQVGDWSYTVGQFELGLRPGHGESMSRVLVRGQPVALKIGFPGWPAANYQTVALGQYQNMMRSGDKWSIQIRSLLAGLTSRWTETNEETELFYTLGGEPNGAGETFVVTTAFVAGAASIKVDDASAALQEGSEGYILELSPDGGDPYFVHAATKAAATFSTLTPIFDAVTTNEDGTNKAIALQTGTVAGRESVNVRIGALIKDEPADIVRKVLTSTGTGTNGTHDTLPASWGLGLAEEHFDSVTFPHIDMVLRSGGVGDLYAYALGPEQNAVEWMQSVLSPYGAFLCERQGQISMGVMTDPADGNTTWEWWVDDTEIAEIVSYEAWNSGQPVEYGVLTGVAAGGTTRVTVGDSTDVETRPNVAERVVDFPYADDSTWVTTAVNRLDRWYRVVGEPFELVLRGWRLAGAAPGDDLVVWSQRLQSRDPDSPLGDGAHAHIISVEPDWFGSSTRIRAVHLPTTPAPP